VAANNAVLHAYREDPGHTVDLEIVLDPKKMVFDVIDTGRSADPAKTNADHRAALSPSISSGNPKEWGRFGDHARSDGLGRIHQQSPAIDQEVEKTSVES
jgi:hypothetical protein